MAIVARKPTPTPAVKKDLLIRHPSEQSPPTSPPTPPELTPASSSRPAAELAIANHVLESDSEQIQSTLPPTPPKLTPASVSVLDGLTPLPPITRQDEPNSQLMRDLEDVKAKLAAEREAKLAAEREAKLAAEREAKLAAQAKAKLVAERKARLAAEEKAKLAAQTKDQLVAETKARLAAEEKVNRLETSIRLKSITIPGGHLNPSFNRILNKEATKGMQNFIKQVIENPVGLATQPGELSLICGLAGSVIAKVVIRQEGAFEWLAEHGGHHLAKWAEDRCQSSQDSAHFDLGRELHQYINGVFNADRTQIIGVHPDVGQDVVRLLQFLGMPQLLKKEVAQPPPNNQRQSLKMFSAVLDGLGQFPVHNAYIFSYTVQVVATQSFSMLMEQASNSNTAIMQEFQEVKQKLEELNNRPTIFVRINTGGGTYIGGNLEVGGDFIRENKIVHTSFCCAPDEAISQ